VGLSLASDSQLDPWRRLAPGLELASFTVDRATVRVMRIDPDQWETVALAASATGGAARTARAWGREFGLAAVVNAGMYATDGITHTGYFRTGSHVNNGRWVQRDYRQVACFEPREAGLPAFTLVDLDSVPPDRFADRYDIVVQNLRLIGKPGRNRWSPSHRRWSEACLAEDSRGRMLWILCRQPLDMHAFNEMLLRLPLDLVAAQHLEGGPQAQLWIDSAHLDQVSPGPPSESSIDNDDNALTWPIPNVLGIRRRSVFNSE